MFTDRKFDLLLAFVDRKIKALVYLAFDRAGGHQ
jgi:hypothetical protein